MENANEKPLGLIARISTLLNNDVCSDVVLDVKYNGQRKAFYAHSPILIAAGNGFPELQSLSSQLKVVKIIEFSPYIVEMMLTYIYTDELNILSMENAVDLYKLARMYHIDDLEKLCNNYIIKEEVNLDNLFVKYESALSCNFPKLLEKCRNLVQSETKVVFASRYFGEASFAVVEDIFRLDSLNVSSELDVIQAAFRWSASECRRKGRPTEKLCIRDAIEPLLKYLRFLSLSADEFFDFSKRDDNIFTSWECILLTRKLLEPDYKGEFPSYFCSISEPRQPYNRNRNNMVTMNKLTDFQSQPVKPNVFKEPYSRTVNPKEIYDKPIQKINDTYIPGPALRNARFSESIRKNNFQDSNPEVANGNNFNPSSPGPESGLKSGQGDVMFFRQSFDKSPPALTKVEQKPIFPQYGQKKYTPMLKVMPQTQSFRQTFDFSLKDLRKDIRFASQRDIKCNAKIRLLTGAILIHGIELKITEEKHIRDETIEVHSCIANNNSSKVETYPLELKNNMLSLLYNEPVRVTVGNPTDLEITIEDLHLNRCFVCQGQTYELNNGLSCKAEISVRSNQSNGQDNILYLISRIIYSCSV